MSDKTLRDLREQVIMFQMMKHMGTSYLVNDLDRACVELPKAVIDAHKSIDVGSGMIVDGEVAREVIG